jgi:hypothetical protein
VKLLVFLIILAFSGTSAAEPVRENIYSYRPADSWVGEKFIFHPKPKNLRQFRYVNIYLPEEQAKKGLEKHPAYEDCVGKTVTVFKVDFKDEDNFTVYLRSDSDGTEFKAVTDTGCIEGLVAMADIENARKAFNGKKLWYLKENILHYDEERDSYNAIYAPRYSHLEVIGIEPGWSNKTPVRFVLNNGYDQTGYVEINLSGTNVPKSVRAQDRLRDYFSIDNPKNWSKITKSYVDKSMIRPGMTSGQVQMSWGAPVKIINLPENTEKWLYPYGDCLYFKNNKLEKITEETE